MGVLHEKTIAISAYLHESGTWNRMKSLAVLDAASGGLALFAEGSHAFHQFFSPAPPRNIGERPDTTAALLSWLNGRSRTLAQLVRADSLSRTLKGKQNIMAKDTLLNPRDTVLRRVAYVSVKQSMYMYYFIEGHENVAASASFQALLDKAKDIMTSTTLTDRVLEYLGHTRVEVEAALGNNPRHHWVNVAVQMTPGLTQGEKDVVMDDARDFYIRVAQRMQAHLDLNAVNIMRSTWLAARMLSVPMHFPFHRAALGHECDIKWRANMRPIFGTCCGTILYGTRGDRCAAAVQIWQMHWQGCYRRRQQTPKLLPTSFWKG